LRPKSRKSFFTAVWSFLKRVVAFIDEPPLRESRPEAADADYSRWVPAAPGRRSLVLRYSEGLLPEQGVRLDYTGSGNEGRPAGREAVEAVGVD
jgi:hypothetical protein